MIEKKEGQKDKSTKGRDGREQEAQSVSVELSSYASVILCLCIYLFNYKHVLTSSEASSIVYQNAIFLFTDVCFFKDGSVTHIVRDDNSNLLFYKWYDRAKRRRGEI